MNQTSWCQMSHLSPSSMPRLSASPTFSNCFCNVVVLNKFQQLQLSKHWEYRVMNWMQKQSKHTWIMSSSLEFQQHQSENSQLPQPGTNSVSWRDHDLRGRERRHYLLVLLTIWINAVKSSGRNDRYFAQPKRALVRQQLFTCCVYLKTPPKSPKLFRLFWVLWYNS